MRPVGSFSIDTTALASCETASGRCENPTAELLNMAVRKELNRPLEDMVAAGSVCFLRPSPPLLYPRDVESFQEYLHQGMGYAIQHVEARNTEIRDICDQLKESHDCLVTASVYVSRKGDASMADHVDAWNALIVQIMGTKRFHLRKQSPQNVEFTHVMQEGRWLWMRSGVVHRVETPERPSVHLSINIHNTESAGPAV